MPFSEIMQGLDFLFKILRSSLRPFGIFVVWKALTQGESFFVVFLGLGYLCGVHGVGGDAGEGLGHGEVAVPEFDHGGEVEVCYF